MQWILYEGSKGRDTTQRESVSITEEGGNEAEFFFL